MTLPRSGHDPSRVFRSRQDGWSPHKRYSLQNLRATKRRLLVFLFAMRPFECDDRKETSKVFRSDDATPHSKSVERVVEDAHDEILDGISGFCFQ